MQDEEIVSASDEWTEQIDAAFPTRSGSHDAYATAMRMVGNRRTKGDLVALVNWLLVEREKAVYRAKADVTWEGDGQREIGHTRGPRPAVIWIGVNDDDTGVFYPNDWEIMAGGFSARGTEASAEEAKRRALMVAQAIGDGFVPPGHTLFSLDATATARALAWQREHDAKHEGGYGCSGGKYTFSFCPTSLGTVVKVMCHCGDKVDLSDYENW